MLTRSSPNASARRTRQNSCGYATTVSSKVNSLCEDGKDCKSLCNGVSMMAKEQPSNDLVVIYVQSATHLQLLCNVTATPLFGNVMNCFLEVIQQSFLCLPLQIQGI